MTLIFKQAIKLCKDAQSDVKPRGANLVHVCFVGVYVHTYMCVYACVCTYAKKNYEMHVYLFNKGC